MTSRGELCTTCSGPLTCPTCSTLDDLEHLVERIVARLDTERTLHG